MRNFKNDYITRITDFKLIIKREIFEFLRDSTNKLIAKSRFTIIF